MQLSHARDDGLARVLIDLDPEGRILFCQTSQRVCHSRCISQSMWLDSHIDHWLRESNRLKNHRV